MKKKIAAILSGIIAVTSMAFSMPISAEEVRTKYTEPQSPSQTYNMNIDWKYTRPEGAFPLKDAVASVKQTTADGREVNFYDAEYDDSKWETVSVPHAINALDSFDETGGDFGERHLYRGFSLYRKNITISESDIGKKAFLEFESVRQSIYLYVNGEMVGYYELGVNAVGFDVTDYLKAGDNVIAVATDNNSGSFAADNPAPTWVNGDGETLTAITRETMPGHTPGDGSGIEYQWNTSDFNPVQGGITGNVNLYTKGSIYQTLPLYNNLKTTGNYVYATDFDISGKSARITVESEIRNESGNDKNITAEVSIVDDEGYVVATMSNSGDVKAAGDTDVKIMSTLPADAYESEPAVTNAETVDVSKIVISSVVDDLDFWSPDAPHLYDVYTVLKDGDTVIDVDKQTTGFRKVEYDINNGGVKINEKAVWLTGYAQRSTNEWAAIGVANDWLTDMDMQLVRESNANMVRWMHIAPKPNAVRSSDKYGVVTVCPGADRESDQKGRVWAARVEAMRDTVIYFRNSPSVIFWEAGNQSISADHMTEMAKIMNELDPNGGRFVGSRSIGTVEQLADATYTGTILGKISSTITMPILKDNMKAIGRYMPVIESEYARQESPRRVWDDFSPPDYRYRNYRAADGNKKDGYDVYTLTSEGLAIANVDEYAKYYGGRIGGQEGTDYYAGTAALCWTDSNQHNRNAGSESNRSSGRVDPIRLKKESFYTYQVMQSEESQCYILGHWNYPQLSEDTYNYTITEKNTSTNYWEETDRTAKRDPKNKTVYVVGTADISRMGLYVNGELVGMDQEPKDYFLFEFGGVDITQSGKIEAIGYNARGQVIARHEIETAGEKASIRLTPVTGPEGLRADGSDIMYFDVEVVDENGRVCPLNYEKISFSLEGEGTFLGGFNSGEGRAVENYGRSVKNDDGTYTTENEIGQDFVYAECGTNRVFVRSTRNAGELKLTASMDGVEDTVVTLNSTAFNIENGVTTVMQQSRPQDEFADTPDEPIINKISAMFPLANVFTAIEGVNTRIVEETVDVKDEYTVTVNGNEVAMTTKAYKPDDTAGVLGEIVPILDALKVAGVDVGYTLQTEGAIPDGVEGTLPLLTITAKNNIVYLTNGMTTLTVSVNGVTETNTTNWPTGCVNGQLMPELVPVLSYIDGIMCEIDAEGKQFKITVKSN